MVGITVPWQQLTYASVEASAGRGGGWGVTGKTPGLRESDLETLKHGIVTRLDEVTPTDEFAKREELDRRDRRLTYRPLGGGGAWWHAVAAGKDATGRPGNVFTHAVLIDDAPRALRPIDLWRSPDWLAPFGAKEVTNAKVGAFGRIGPVSDDFLTLALEHPEATEALLSAVTTCFESDRSLVLAGATTDDFVGWLRVISYLTSHSIAWQIPFSTYVRASELNDADQGFQIVGLPHLDLDEVLASVGSGTGSGLVLDLADLPTDRLGDHWSYGGQTWHAGQTWQDAFYNLAGLDREAISDTLAAMDEVTPGLPLEARLSPEWSLALAHLSCRGASYPEARSLTEEWRRLEPWDLPAVAEVLQGLDLPGDHVHSAEGPTGNEVDTLTIQSSEPVARVPLARILVTIPMHNPRIGAELAAADPELRWADLPAAVDQIRAAQAAVTHNDGDWSVPVRQALAVWLAAEPLLATLGSRRSDGDEIRRESMLIQIGLCPIYIAQGSHLQRAVEILSLSEYLPPSLIASVQEWHRTYTSLHPETPASEESADE